MKTWASEARKVLGLGRLTTKRYDEVLAAGFSAGLFQLDETTLSFPILVAMEPEPVPEEVEEEAQPPEAPLEEDVRHLELLKGGLLQVGRDGRRSAEDLATLGAGDLAEVQADLEKLESLSLVREEEGTYYLPEFTPPSHLACGHWDRQSVPDPSAPEPPAEDYHRKVRTISVSVGSPEACPSCAAGKPGDPRYQEGEYRKPVPLASRRTPEKSASSYPGFPGLCTDPETGFYIGGIANDCSRYHPGTERCVFHAVKPRKDVKDA